MRTVDAEHPPAPRSGAAAAEAARRAVVVGVDGSPGSCAALEHAFEEGVRRDRPVVVVTAFQPVPPESGLPVPDPEDQRRDLRRMIAHTVDRVAATRRSCGLAVPPIVLVVRAGPTAVVLTTVSSRADLLVVGRRGRGLGRSTLLGSASLACVLRGACPVTVVGPPLTPGAGAGRSTISSE